MREIRYALLAVMVLVLSIGGADAGTRRVRRVQAQQQSSWSLWDLFSGYGIGYIPTPSVPLSGAYSAGYCAVLNGVATHLRYNEEMYPWEAYSCLDYIVPFVGTIMGYAYQRNLKQICAAGPGSFAYSFRQDSPYIIDRPAGAYALNAYYSICGGRAVSHSTLPPKGYQYPSYPHDWSNVSPY